MNRMCMRVRVVLRARSELGSRASPAFTDTRGSKTGMVTARSHTESECTQSLVDIKGTLFDVNINHRSFSSNCLSGVRTPLA